MDLRNLNGRELVNVGGLLSHSGGKRSVGRQLKARKK